MTWLILIEDPKIMRFIFTLFKDIFLLFMLNNSGNIFFFTSNVLIIGGHTQKPQLQKLGSFDKLYQTMFQENDKQTLP